MKEIISRLVEGRDLSEAEAYEAMSGIMGGNVTEAQTAAFLVALRIKGETVGEVAGCARAMREKALRITVSSETVGLDRDEINVDRETIRSVVDTCGTGGDGTNTFNISTATALVAAAGGCRIAKHGNRSVSSLCGSADVVRALGVNVDLSPDLVGKCLEEVGIAFFYAPLYHSAMKYALPVRTQLGIRTVFNLLGPLTNPASAGIQLIGVYEPSLTVLVARVLERLGSRSALVVHGEGRLDEISLAGETVAARLEAGRITRLVITPEQAGLERAPLEAVRGGDAGRNARIILDILEGGKGAPRDIVLLNAGAVFWVAGREPDIASGVARARRAVDSGRALACLEKLVETSNRLGGEAGNGRGPA